MTGWSEPVFVEALAIIAAVRTLINERFGYFLAGFLTRGYFLVEYYEPGVLTLPLFPFFMGGVIGSLIRDILNDHRLHKMLHALD